MTAQLILISLNSYLQLIGVLFLGDVSSIALRDLLSDLAMEKGKKQIRLDIT